MDFFEIEMNRGVMNMLVQVFMWTYVVVVFFLDKYLGVQLLGHCWLILEEIQNRFQNVCTILNFFLWSFYARFPLLFSPPFWAYLGGNLDCWF